MAIGMVTNGKLSSTDLSNFVDLNVANELRRITGVGNVQIFGERKYAMRLWVDPKKMADYGIAASDVVNALQGKTSRSPRARSAPRRRRVTTPITFRSARLVV